MIKRNQFIDFIMVMLLCASMIGLGWLSLVAHNKTAEDNYDTGFADGAAYTAKPYVKTQIEQMGIRELIMHCRDTVENSNVWVFGDPSPDAYAKITVACFEDGNNEAKWQRDFELPVNN